MRLKKNYEFVWPNTEKVQGKVREVYAHEELRTVEPLCMRNALNATQKPEGSNNLTNKSRLQK